MAQTITPRGTDYAQWYNDLIIIGNLADYSAVRGCMIIKPYGFALWENMQQQLDKMFKDTGHSNVYFPLFVPKSLFEAEEQNAAGFAKECAIVTHYRLKSDPNKPGKLMVDPEAKLEEELIVRPTSEAIIWSTFKNWIQSYRNLPLLLNQWCNVVRWEMRTRLFLRTAEFLWQEGHTAHATAQEAIDETLKMLDVYTDFAENWMALPVIKGKKSAAERFAGAMDTYCIEAMMQDGKALQAGTSHFLGQNFAKAFDVKFSNKDNTLEYVWATSWGVSTRLIGALVMAHSDDQGLVLPPKIAPIQVVIIPIFKGEDTKEALNTVCLNLYNQLKQSHIRVKLDNNDNTRPGWKFNEYETQGVPIRISIGSKELQNNHLEIVRRDTKEKTLIPVEDAFTYITNLLIGIQTNLFEKAKVFQQQRTKKISTLDELNTFLDQEPGFALIHWDGTTESEEKLQTLTKATIRCIPLEPIHESGFCIISGKPSSQRVVAARAY